MLFGAIESFEEFRFDYPTQLAIPNIIIIRDSGFYMKLG
jgi:hypothetical protein